ncbi:hypothetical protein L6452_35977 [Arctium lappa]|uniref:Uncharacterized protein n=1 Tax=Arctium lappa TaxID=4217 RepID=A0ACB8Y771_ARCLA|nr:hypothetical protein L6452_35977 [Arctium lappa]
MAYQRRLFFNAPRFTIFSIEKQILVYKSAWFWFDFVAIESGSSTKTMAFIYVLWRIYFDDGVMQYLI